MLPPERAGDIPIAMESGVHAAGEEAEEAPAEAADVEMQDTSQAAEAARWFEERDLLPDPTIRQPIGEPSASAAAAEPSASSDANAARETAAPEGYGS